MGPERVGLDTNVLVRMVRRDTPAQAAAADRFLQGLIADEREAWVAVPVVLELVWTLAGPRMGLSKAEVVEIIRSLTLTHGIAVEHERAVLAACGEWLHGAGSFAEYLVSHVNAALGIAETYTFDRRASRRARSLRLLDSGAG